MLTLMTLMRLRCSGAPVHQELDEDNEDADQHDKPHQDQAPPEHRETVRFRVRVFGESVVTVTWPVGVSIPNIHECFS